MNSAMPLDPRTEQRQFAARFARERTGYYRLDFAFGGQVHKDGAQSTGSGPCTDHSK